MEIWSLPKHENLKTSKKILWKRREIAPKEQFLLLFSTIFSIYLLTSRVQLHIYLLNVVVRIMFFSILQVLICRGTDISKYFGESLGIRNELFTVKHFLITCAEFDYIRTKYFNVKIIKELFNDIPTKKILDFLKEIGHFNKI